MSGRFRAAWYCLRGRTVVFNANIDFTTLNVSGTDRALIQNTTLFGPRSPGYRWRRALIRLANAPEAAAITWRMR